MFRKLAIPTLLMAIIAGGAAFVLRTSVFKPLSSAKRFQPAPVYIPEPLNVRIARSRELGIKSANEDIKAGRVALISFRNSAAVSPKIDAATGLPINYSLNCIGTPESITAEEDAYNATVRAWHAKHGEKKSR